MQIRATQTSQVTSEERARVLNQQPAAIWLTGLSGSGKSTVAYALERTLVEAGRFCYVLDGDSVRQGLNRDLGFSAADRHENIRRVAEVARLFTRAGMIIITAFISPFRADRDFARTIVQEAMFMEVFVDASLEVCETRDPKGLYKKARAGEIANFTGISSPYEAPFSPEVHLDTEQETPDGSTRAIVEALCRAGILDSDCEEWYGYI